VVRAPRGALPGRAAPAARDRDRQFGLMATADLTFRCVSVPEIETET
jgi:hypothetical protein